jgi:hypothetical protein
MLPWHIASRRRESAYLLASSTLIALWLWYRLTSRTALR